jgi:hypothetical protein
VLLSLRAVVNIPIATHDTGIIDFLQYYNAKKMGETVIKKMSSNEDISCVDPETYGNRFVKFVSSLIEKE